MTLRRDLLRIASDLPVGDPTRRKILAAVANEKGAKNVLGRAVGLIQKAQKADFQDDGDLQGALKNLGAALRAVGEAVGEMGFDREMRTITEGSAALHDRAQKLLNKGK